MKSAAFLSTVFLAVSSTAYATTIAGVCHGVPASVPCGDFDPNDPVRHGYNLVFDSEFTNFNDFDLTCTAPPANTGCQNPAGKNWYLNSWTYPTNANTASYTTDMSITAGVLAISQQTLVTGNWAISTMAPKAGATHGPDPWQQNWNGIVFTGGWYVEARVASEYKNGATVVDAPGYAPGHSAFWSYAIDHFNASNPGGKWPGQSGNYIHIVENDMMDGVQGTVYYQTNLIDWYSTANTPVNATGTGFANEFNQVNVTTYGFPNPSFVNKTSFHIYGQLWVPATATAAGYLQNYFDGVKTSKFTWNLYNPATPPPPSGANTASIIDQDHMPVILGADPPTGGDPRVTMYVDWVHVWQKPAAMVASGNTEISPQANFKGGNGSCP